MQQHVAILTPGFAVNEADTNCVPALQDFLLGLQRSCADIQTTVFTLRHPRLRGSYSWHGMPVFAANGGQLSFPKSVPSWSRLMRNFARTMRRQPVRLVHSFWLGECAMLGECLSRFYGIPHVITLMGQEAKGGHRYVRLLQSRRTLFVAVSEFQRQEVLNRTGCDVHEVIPWGIEAPRVRHIGTRDIDVLGVGSLNDVKDFSTFLDVVALLHQTSPRIACRIAGDGPQRQVLESKADRLGLRGTVQFVGRISREAVLELMSRSRVLLHTSKFESFGMVFAEALACGVRIVSRPVGIAEPGPNWFLSGDPNEMAVGVRQLLQELEPTARVVHPLEATVAAYRNLYRLAATRRETVSTPL